jgi:hypothetical protein
LLRKYFEVVEYEQDSRSGKIPAGRFGGSGKRREGRGIEMRRLKIVKTEGPALNVLMILIVIVVSLSFWVGVESTPRGVAPFTNDKFGIADSLTSCVSRQDGELLAAR